MMRRCKIFHFDDPLKGGGGKLCIGVLLTYGERNKITKKKLSL